MINAQQALHLAAQVVETQGADFVYAPNGQSCFNVPLTVIRAQNPGIGELIESDPREQTGCLVGRILDLAGETRHRMEEFHGYSMSGLYNRFPDIATLRAVKVLSDMQSMQDTGNSWGNALGVVQERYAAGQYDDLKDELPVSA